LSLSAGILTGFLQFVAEKGIGGRGGNGKILGRKNCGLTGLYNGGKGFEPF
jgi:hypothetical protein